MALMLPGVRSHLHLGLSQKPCWTTGLRVPPHQRQRPQLGPRALSLRVRFLLPVSLSSQSGFLPRPPSSHQEFPQPFYLFLLFSLASQPTPPRGSLPRSAPLLQPTQCWSWVCGSHLRLRPGRNSQEKTCLVKFIQVWGIFTTSLSNRKSKKISREQQKSI